MILRVTFSTIEYWPTHNVFCSFVHSRRHCPPCLQSSHFFPDSLACFTASLVFFLEAALRLGPRAPPPPELNGPPASHLPGKVLLSPFFTACFFFFLVSLFGFYHEPCCPGLASLHLVFLGGRRCPSVHRLFSLSLTSTPYRRPFFLSRLFATDIVSSLYSSPVCFFHVRMDLAVLSDPSRFPFVVLLMSSSVAATVA